MSLRRVPLGAVCTQDRASVRPGQGDELPYLGLEGIESGTGRFVEGDLSKTPEVPQANSFRFDERHVLYGKLRPYLNKVALPTSSGKCSTEIIPLLPTPDCDRQYLGYFLRAPSTVQQITERSAGARMPRADMDFVLSLPIPLPALDEQRRIVDLLTRSEGIVRLRRQAQQKAAALVPAIFVDMFGDPATNPNGWPTQPLGDLLKAIDSGKSPKCHDRPRQDDEWGVLRLSAVSSCEYDDAEHKTLPAEAASDATLEVRAGDLLISRKNTAELVGASAFVWATAGRMLLPDLIFRLRISDAAELDSIYLWKLLTTPAKRRALTRLASGSAGSMPNISKERLRTLPIELPPSTLQASFNQRVQQIRAVAVQQTGALAKAEQVFDAMLARAFSEEHGATAVRKIEEVVS